MNNTENNCTNCTFSIQHSDGFIECNNPKCGDFGAFMEGNDITRECEFFESHNVSDELEDGKGCQTCKFYKKELIDPCCWVHWCESEQERLESLCNFCMNYQPKEEVKETSDKSKHVEFDRNYKLFKNLRKDRHRHKRDDAEDYDISYSDLDDFLVELKKFDYETLKSIVGESDFRTYLKVRITLLWNRFYKDEDKSVLSEIDFCISILEQDLNGWNRYDY